MIRISVKAVHARYLGQKWPMGHFSGGGAGVEGAAVARLLAGIGPSPVARLIIAVGIGKSIYRMPGRWALANVRGERLETVKPAVTDLDPKRA